VVMRFRLFGGSQSGAGCLVRRTEDLCLRCNPRAPFSRNKDRVRAGVEMPGNNLVIGPAGRNLFRSWLPHEKVYGMYRTIRGPTVVVIARGKRLHSFAAIAYAP
jgi:hypothetical protein